MPSTKSDSKSRIDFSANVADAGELSKTGQAGSSSRTYDPGEFLLYPLFERLRSSPWSSLDLEQNAGWQVMKGGRRLTVPQTRIALDGRNHGSHAKCVSVLTKMVRDGIDNRLLRPGDANQKLCQLLVGNRHISS
ncbi:hypothetical protein [Paraburkholderia sp. EG304]|uniref:hypothetical protein n=1 Tax=Paraburkholderia sp. EG304 TaxID=3237015 RepID=UPI00397CC476